MPLYGKVAPITTCPFVTPGVCSRAVVRAVAAAATTNASARTPNTAILFFTKPPSVAWIVSDFSGRRYVVPRRDHAASALDAAPYPPRAADDAVRHQEHDGDRESAVDHWRRGLREGLGGGV